MHLICVVFILLSVEAKCTNINDLKKMDPNYGETWMFFPDDEGNPQIIDLTEPDPNMRFAFIDEDPDAKIALYYYNKQTRDSPKLLKSEGASHRHNFTIIPDFDSNKKTKIIIHGWKNNLNSPAIQLVKNAYLNGGDYNIIAVDWNEMANENNYMKSAGSTKFVGKNVAAVIDHLVIKKNANIDDIHIIGHSLGAHTAGYSGMYTTSGKVGRITGLDPAYPGFRDTEKTNQNLDKSDAQFVDVIHTCAGLLGHNKPLGNADFFPNGGHATQPGCDMPSDIIGSCSHGRAYVYFAESIETKTGFMAYKCDSWEDYQSKDCNADPIQMGDSTPSTANGSYYLETTSGPTYSRFFKIN